MSRIIRETETEARQPVWGPLPENGALLTGERDGAADKGGAAGTDGAVGKYVLSARDARVRTDSRGHGGPEIYAGELLLGALASCALGAVEGAAAEQGVALRDLRVAVRSERGETVPPRYLWFSIDFEVRGVDEEQAEALVDVFLDVCPIYSTLAAVTPVVVRVSADV